MEFTLNTSPDVETGVTPFFLAHGREAGHPLSLIFQPSNHTLPQSTQNRMSLLGKAIEARRRQQQTLLQSQTSPRRTITPKSFSPGEQVMLKVPPIPSKTLAKISPRYLAGYMVTRKLNPSTYLVQKPGGKPKRVHCSQMKLEPAGLSPPKCNSRWHSASSE